MKSTHLRLLLQHSGSRRLFFVSIVAAFTWVGIIVTSALVLARVIVAIIDKDTSAFTLIMLLVALWGFRAVFQSAFESWSSIQASSIKVLIRHEVSSDLQSYSHVSPSVITTLLVKGLNSLDVYLGRFIPQLFFAAIVPAVVIITIFLLDPLSALIATLTLPLIPLFGALIGRYTADSVSKKWRTLGSLSAYFEDSLRGFVTLKIFGRHTSQSVRIEEMGDRYTRETMKVLKISFLSALALELAATISVALIAVTIGLRLVNGSIALQTGLFILIIAPEVYWPIRQVAGYFHAAADGVAAFEKLFKILDRPEVKNGESFNKITAITWSELTVDYSNRTSVHVPPGQITSGKVNLLIGPSGSGKSTLANILLGFIKPTSGEVIFSTDLGDIPLSQISILTLREKISWLPQEPKFPIGSVGQILRHAKPDATDFELVEILEKVDLDILDLAHGLSTRLGTLKQPLSTGQLRKIALARALLKPHQLLILDEPTASVDDVSEKIISQILEERAAQGALILLITHRVSMIAGATNITDLVHHK